MRIDFYRIDQIKDHIKQSEDPDLIYLSETYDEIYKGYVEMMFDYLPMKAKYNLMVKYFNAMGVPADKKVLMDCIYDDDIHIGINELKDIYRDLKIEEVKPQDDNNHCYECGTLLEECGVDNDLNSMFECPVCDRKQL